MRFQLVIFQPGGTAMTNLSLSDLPISQRRERIITKAPKAGEKLTLNAGGSFDLDNNNLCFKWWIVSAADRYEHAVQLQNSDQFKATLNVPVDSLGKVIQIICEVTDDGTPSLSSYRRIIVEPTNSTDGF